MRSDSTGAGPIDKALSLMGDVQLRGMGIVTIAGGMTSVVNYSFLIAMGWILNQAEYGEFGALFILYFSFSFVLMTTVRFAITDTVARELSVHGEKYIFWIRRTLYVVLMLMGIVASLIFLGSSWTIHAFLKTSSIGLIWMVIGAFFLSWSLSCNLGALQGRKAFLQMSLTNLGREVIKLILGVVLGIIGFGVFGAVTGLLIGVAAANLISFVFLDRTFTDRVPRKPQHHSKPTQQTIVHIVFIFVAVFCLTFPITMDLVLVKHLFTAQQTGLYTAASVFGRVMVFLPLGIATAMFPMAVEAVSKGKDPAVTLGKAMIFDLLLAGPVCFVLLVIPQLPLSILYGAEYMDAVPLLRLMSISTFIFSLISIMTYYLLASKRYVPIGILLVSTLIILGGMWIFNESMVQLLYFRLFAFTTLLVVLASIIIADLVWKRVRSRIS